MDIDGQEARKCHHICRSRNYHSSASPMDSTAVVVALCTRWHYILGGSIVRPW